MTDGTSDGTRTDHPIPLFSTRRGGLAPEVLAYLGERAPAEFTPTQVGKAIGRAARGVSKALLRLESRRLVVRGERRGSWAGRVSPEALARSEPAEPALHAIQVALPGVRLEGGLPLPRSLMRDGRRLTLQDGLVSVHATFNPVPVSSWSSFVEELGEALNALGVKLDVEEARLVSVELNLDYQTWRLRGLESVRLQDAPGCWAQVYNKEMPDGSRVMRAEIRATPADFKLSEVGGALAMMKGLHVLDAVQLLRRFQA